MKMGKNHKIDAKVLVSQAIEVAALYIYSHQYNSGNLDVEITAFNSQKLITVVVSLISVIIHLNVKDRGIASLQ